MLDKFAPLSLTQWLQVSGEVTDAKVMLANYDVVVFTLVPNSGNFQQ